MRKKRFFSRCLVLYLLVIAHFTLFRTPSVAPQYKLTLFWSYRVFRRQWKQILNNILLFTPLGFLLCGTGKSAWKSVLLGFLLSIGIELVQLLGHLGLCELDDVFHNTVGALTGCGLYNLYRYCHIRR